MTQQDKDLLLRDLCARAPYEPLIYVDEKLPRLKIGASTRIWEYVGVSNPCKPYLRTLSNLTQEERDKFCDIGGVISHRPDGKLYLVAYFPEALDYLNSIHADYRGMIEKGLAIEVTEENNPYK